jgi:hypothetical protein
MPEQQSSTGSEQSILAQWDFRIPILANPTVMRDLGLAFGLPIVGMGIFIGAIARPIIGLVLTLAMGALFFFGLLIAHFVLGGGYNAKFLVTSEGVWFLSGQKEQVLAAIVSAGGLMAGSLSTAGAGLLARMEKTVFIPWKDVSGVTINEKRRTIKVRRVSLMKPIMLYCTDGNFREVATIVQSKSSTI